MSTAIAKITIPAPCHVIKPLQPVDEIYEIYGCPIFAVAGVDLNVAHLNSSPAVSVFVALSPSCSPSTKSL